MCIQKQLSTGDSCQKNYVVEVAGVKAQYYETKKVVFDSPRQSQSWKCGPHAETFTIDQRWNTVEWWRQGSAGSSIQWRVFSCSLVGEFSGPSGYRVKIKKDGSSCLSLPTGHHAKVPAYPYGIEEELKTYPCSSNEEKQDFLLYITDSSTNSKYKLRPFKAVNPDNKKGIDVCVVEPSMKIYE